VETRGSRNLPNASVMGNDGKKTVVRHFFLSFFEATIGFEHRQKVMAAHYDIIGCTLSFLLGAEGEVDVRLMTAIFSVIVRSNVLLQKPMDKNGSPV
jgi:hypothetical protein